MKNLNKRKIFRRSISLAVLAAVVLAICGAVYTKNVFNDISESVVRLHVIANSNSDEDQQLKLKVRNATIAYTKTLIAECDSADNAVIVMSEHTDDIRKAAQDCLRQEGSNYTAEVYVGEYYFPAKSYGNYSFPSGDYQALRVVIGEGEGKNWWCVLFPPLCYVNAGAVCVQQGEDDVLSNYMSDEAYSVVNGGNSDGNVTVKFKVVEVFQNLFSSVKKLFR